MGVPPACGLQDCLRTSFRKCNETHVPDSVFTDGDFFSFLRYLQGGLERLLQRRSGLRGRFQEILGTARMTEDIARHRMRLNELRSNFLVCFPFALPDAPIEHVSSLLARDNHKHKPKCFWNSEQRRGAPIDSKKPRLP